MHKPPLTFNNLSLYKDAVAVTGADGFIGRGLCQRLPEARKLDRKKYRLEDVGSLKEFLEDVKVVVHLAGINAGSGYSPSVEDLTANNISATRNLVEAIRRFCPQKPLVVLVSSIHVYSKKEQHFFEHTTLGPASYYGLTKLAQEIIIQQAHESGILDCCIFRASNVYGAGCRPYYNSAVATFVDKIQKGDAIQLFAQGKAGLDLIHLDDVLDVLLRAPELICAQDPVYNLSSGITTTIEEVVEIMGRLMNVAPAVEYLDNQAASFDVNNQKLVTKLSGLSFLSLEEGLRRTIDTPALKI